MVALYTIFCCKILESIRRKVNKSVIKFMTHLGFCPRKVDSKMSFSIVEPLCSGRTTSVNGLGRTFQGRKQDYTYFP